MHETSTTPPVVYDALASSSLLSDSLTAVEGSSGRFATIAPISEWPTLRTLLLDEEDRALRLRSIGGSDANIILSGDAERVRQLWREKRGEAEPVDLSNNLSVMLGCWTEPFNRQWFERLSDHTVTAGECSPAADTPGEAAPSTG